MSERRNSRVDNMVEMYAKYPSEHPTRLSAEESVRTIQSILDENNRLRKENDALRLIGSPRCVIGEHGYGDHVGRCNRVVAVADDAINNGAGNPDRLLGALSRIKSIGIAK